MSACARQRVTSQPDTRPLVDTHTISCDAPVLFWSDVPLMDPRIRIGKIITADISDKAKRQVLGLNAAKLLNPEDYSEFGSHVYIDQLHTRHLIGVQRGETP